MSTLGMTRRTFVAGTTLAGLATVAARGILASPAWAAGVAKVSETAPAFTTAATNGRSVSLADQRGKLVILEWTNHDCPYVRKHYETGNMQALQKETTAQGVIWLTLISSSPGTQGYVTPTQAEIIKFSQLDGSITLTLRSAKDFVDANGNPIIPAPSGSEGITLKKLTTDFAVPIPELVEAVLPAQAKK